MAHKIIEGGPLLSKYRLQPGFINKKDQVDSLHININRQNLNEFFNFLADQKIWTAQDEQAYKDIEKSAERLIALIKKEYRIE